VPHVRAIDLGIRFEFDRQGRPMTAAMARVRRRSTHSWGLRGVTVEVASGESVALIGPNGAGKTTFLRALAGVYAPDEGRVEVAGRIGSLLAVRAGLLPPLTGRENAVLLGVLAGLTRADARRAVPAVAERARLGDAFDRPASSYSMGMSARLGLAVAEQARPEVLLLDEVHEALDAESRGWLLSIAGSIVAGGGVVVAAGHDLSELRALCRRAVVFGGGSVRADGPFDEIVERDRPAAAAS
jgi:ABC-type polysaccharide/polyol phosphate transport system ATPase subunit